MKFPLVAAAAAAISMSSASAEIYFNEININPPGDDGSTSNEYIELISSTGGAEAATGLTILQIDSANGGYGTIRQAWSLNGLSTGSNGLLLLGRGYPGTYPFGALPPGTNFGDPSGAPGTDNEWTVGNNEGFTILLVRGFTGSVDDDLDGNDDGILETRPWTTIVDSVGFDDQTGPTLRQTYSVADVTQAGYDVENVSRKVGNFTANSASAWFGGAYPGGADPTRDFVFDTQQSFGGVANARATPGTVNGAAALADLRINEVSVNPPGGDGAFEYIELIRASGAETAANGHHLLVINTDNASDPACGLEHRKRGIIVEAWNLDNVLIGANGLILLGQNYDDDSPWDDYVDSQTVLADVDGLSENDIGNVIALNAGGTCTTDRTNDGFTLLLVTGFTGAVGQDVDADNDDAIDGGAPWTAIVDSIGFGKINAMQNAIVAPTYAPADVSAQDFMPDNVSRNDGILDPNSAAAWYGGEYGGTNGTNISFSGVSFFGGFRGTATPGRPNLDGAPAVEFVILNEVNIDPPGSDNNPDAAPDACPTNNGSGEFIELLNPQETVASLHGYHLLRVSLDAASIGEVVEAWDLSPFSTGPNGLLVLGDDFDTATAFPFGTIRAESHVEDPDGYDIADLVNRSFGLLLVTDYTGATADVDADNDGVLDAGLPFAIQDSVIVGSALTYGAANLPALPFFPQTIARYPDSLVQNSGAAWYGGVIVDTFCQGSLTYSDSQYFGSFVGGVTAGQYNHGARPGAGSFRINEANINPPGPDNSFEYVELISTALDGRSANDLTLLVIDTDGANTGTITEAWPLDGTASGPNGLLLLGNDYDLAPKGGPFSGSISALTATADPEGFGSEDLEPNDGLGLVLVLGFFGVQGQDLDATDDGVFDTTPWTSIVDSVAYGVRVYGMPNMTQATYNPDNFSRRGSASNLNANTANDWYGGSIAGTSGTSVTYDPLEQFDKTGAVSGTKAATPGIHNLGGFIDDLIDNDEDKVVNLIEDALGMLRNTPDAELLPTTGTVTLQGQTYATLTYNRRMAGAGTEGVDYTSTGIRYTVEVSTDLETWVSGASHVELVDTAAGHKPGYQAVTIRSELAGSAEETIYLRLRITRV